MITPVTPILSSDVVKVLASTSRGIVTHSDLDGLCLGVEEDSGRLSSSGEPLLVKTRRWVVVESHSRGTSLLLESHKWRQISIENININLHAKSHFGRGLHEGLHRWSILKGSDAWQTLLCTLVVWPRRKTLWTRLGFVGICSAKRRLR